MEKEIVLTEQKKKKEETIATIKIKKDIQEILDTHTGWLSLGYRSNTLYYALPDTSGWSIFTKKEGEEAGEIFKIPSGVLTSESLDIYEGYITLRRWEDTSFYSLKNGTERDFNFHEKILGIKDTTNDDTKIITSDTGVFMYTVSEKIARQNPLYDDIIQLTSGEIIALVKKTSKAKQSFLSITDTTNDFVFLIGQDTRERKILLKTSKNGESLRYKNGEILFVDEMWEIFVVENVK